MEKKTALYEKHLECGGKMVPFAGYLMPVQYGEGVIAEHKAVRGAAGLFDVSHMGEAMLSGQDAMANLQNWLTNDMEDMAVGRCRYSPMCNEAGGVVDDLLVYRMGKESFLLVINASNREKDVAWMKAHLTGQAVLEDVSDSLAELALQGPRAEAILAPITDGGAGALPQKYYTFTENLKVAGIDCLVSRTGYTGEDGFELYCKTEDAVALWDALLEAGKEEGLIPCGLGARDTLRLEASMPLYGHEMNEEITPMEAGLGFFVKMEKPDFIGKKALQEKGEPKRRRSGLRVIGRGIVREDSPVYCGEKQVGVTTSGTLLPHLGWAGAMALLDVDMREVGTSLEVEVRGRRVPVGVVKLPFYSRSK